MLEPQAALVAIKHGEGTLDHVLTLDSRITLGLINVRRFVDNDGMQTALDAAVAVLASVQQRYERTSTWGVSGDELRTLSHALNLCDSLQTHLSRHDMFQDLRTLTSQRRAKK